MNKQFNIKKIISIIFSLFIVLATVSCSKENINKESKVEYMRGDFAVDVENPYELVGYSDYYFIGEVISQKNTEYRVLLMWKLKMVLKRLHLHILIMK